MYLSNAVPEPDHTVTLLGHTIDLTFYFHPTPRHAYKISVLSCGITAVASIIGFTVFAAAHSPAMLGFGMENLVDLASSGIVVWRFYIGSKTTVTPEMEEKLDKREKRASILIAIVLFVLGVTVLSIAVQHLAEESHGSNNGLLIGLSLPSAVVFGLLALVKFRMANMLMSPSFRKDAICSMFGAILSGGVFIGTCIKSANEGAWWIDGVIAVLVSLACMWIGLRTMLKNIEDGQNKFWTAQFWLSENEEEEISEEGKKRLSMDMRPQEGSGEPNAI